MARADDVIDLGPGDDFDFVFQISPVDDSTGGPGDDVISGGDGDDEFRGGAGDDVLDGDAGDDRITGEGGNDVLRGGAGDDVLSDTGRTDVGGETFIGGPGDDILRVGFVIPAVNDAGASFRPDGVRDTIVFRPGDGRDRVVGFGEEDRLVIEGAASGGVGFVPIPGGSPAFGGRIVVGDASLDVDLPLRELELAARARGEDIVIEFAPEAAPVGAAPFDPSTDAVVEFGDPVREATLVLARLMDASGDTATLEIQPLRAGEPVAEARIVRLAEMEGVQSLEIAAGGRDFDAVRVSDAEGDVTGVAGSNEADVLGVDPDALLI